ncbi:CBASS cGAMP-activated phospholipase [Achromobacter aloeverae]
MAWTVDQPFQALALTGGGYRGLFTARALQEIESTTQSPIGRSFDITYGTSIGGIIALAVAFEVPMSKVVDTFSKYGEAIFPPRRPTKSRAAKLWDVIAHLNKPRYRSEVLREVITKLIDKDATLGDAKHPVGIPAVNVTMGRPQVFKTRHKAEWNRDWKYKAVDVALATSAAPTFFSLAEVGESLYADGGLFANAPDLLALHEAEHFFKVSQDAVRILSIGTTTESYSISFSAGREFGILDWMQDERLFSVMISSQQQMVDQIMQHKLQDRYLRLDMQPSDEQTADLGLDTASEAARRTLLALARKVTTDILGTSLQPYLGHTPQLKIVRD